MVGGDEPVRAPLHGRLPTQTREVPQRITDLYKAGEYLAYGEALRTFRQGLVAI
ncbi:hypothetical protein D3C71_2183040 [compost metagenome]